MTTTTIEMQDVQKRFSELVSLVAAGGEIIILQAQKPVMRLVPVDNGGKQRIPDLHAGMGWMSDDFNAPIVIEW